MWRPKEGWKNPYLEALVVDRERLLFQLPDGGLYIEGKGKKIGANAFEAGADAMLKALGVGEQDADYRHAGWYDDIGDIDKPGWLVFIPDD